MGMNTYVVGIKPPDETWRKMKAVWDACIFADVAIPVNVVEYFDGEEPDSVGVVVKVPSVEYTADMQEGFEIYLDELPKDVKIIRFYNSY